MSELEDRIGALESRLPRLIQLVEDSVGVLRETAETGSQLRHRVVELQAAYNERLLRVIELDEERNALMRPHPDWCKEKCGTCGYWAPKGEYEPTHCRPYPNARKNDPACPKWQPREEPT